MHYLLKNHDHPQVAKKPSHILPNRKPAFAGLKLTETALAKESLVIALARTLAKPTLNLL